MVPSGFLINLDTIWSGLRWISSISYLKFSFDALSTNEFTGLNFTCDGKNQKQNKTKQNTNKTNKTKHILFAMFF